MLRKTTSLRGGRSPTRQPLKDCRYVKRLVDRQRPVADPAGALRASKFAPGEFVVAALLAMTLATVVANVTFRLPSQTGSKPFSISNLKLRRSNVYATDDNDLT